MGNWRYQYWEFGKAHPGVLQRLLWMSRVPRVPSNPSFRKMSRRLQDYYQKATPRYCRRRGQIHKGLRILLIAGAKNKCRMMQVIIPRVTSSMTREEKVQFRGIEETRMVIDSGEKHRLRNNTVTRKCSPRVAPLDTTHLVHGTIQEYTRNWATG